jgi:hypothetical protein
MSRAKRGRQITLGIAKNGAAYIRLKDSGIPPLCAMIDGLPFVLFDKRKTAYLGLETALEWFVNELKHDPKNQDYQAAIEKYRDIIERHKRGEIEYRPQGNSRAEPDNPAPRDEQAGPAPQSSKENTREQ